MKNNRFIECKHQQNNYSTTNSMTAIVCQPMVANKFCAFCVGAGIEGPHDHWLRASKRPNAAITCPKLLEHSCEHCGRKGHTKKHCGELRWELGLKKQEAAAAKKLNFQSGGWSQQVPLRTVPLHAQAPGSIPDSMRGKLKFVNAHTKAKAAPVSMFAALEIDNCPSSDDENVTATVAQEIEEIKAASGITWADRVKSGPPVAPEAAPPKLQPLWGVSRTTRVSNWADDEDD